MRLWIHSLENHNCLILISSIDKPVITPKKTIDTDIEGIGKPVK